MIKLTRLALAILLLAPAAAFAQQDTIVIRAATLLDGKGGVLRDTTIVAVPAFGPGIAAAPRRR